MTPISVFIITKNEADRIEKIICAVKKIADEIIVIDSGSTDKTCEISASLGAKVIFNKWQGYGQQKIFGENQCKNNWILNIDADEEVSPELADEISKIFSSSINDNIAGYKIKIVNKFRFEKKPHILAYSYDQFRLYRKDKAGFNNSSVHDSVRLKSNDPCEIIKLKNTIYHQSFRDYNHWIEKINSYSSMQAIDAFEKNKSANYLKIMISPSVAFFKAYVVRRYFIYGFDGIIYSYLYAFSRFVKMIKIREKFQEKNH
jgi:glycosyltransferase involved in cell wall biosynthesis